jgi:hypothetical protein
VGLLTPKCPVADRERDWIHESMTWFREQFGDGSLRAPVILPTRDYFPPPYTGSDEDVRRLVGVIAEFMGIQHRIDVRFSSDIDHVQNLTRMIPGGPISYGGAAGVYSGKGKDGRPVITLDRSNAEQPGRLIAVIAHELGHVRLLGERRLSADRKDQEPLTDLLTVFLGLGIFTANAAFDFGSLQTSPGMQGWRAQRLGYLTEQMFGYGLACYALLRGEPNPPWAKYLDTNPRVYMQHGIRYLRHDGGVPARPQSG